MLVEDVAQWMLLSEQKNCVTCVFHQEIAALQILISNIQIAFSFVAHQDHSDFKAVSSDEY